MKTNYMIVCYKTLNPNEVQVKHKCCYEKEPEEKEWVDLIRELGEDPEFGMIGDDDYEMMIVTRQDHPFWFKDIPEEIGE